MSAVDPEQVNFVLKNLAEIVTGVVVMLLVTLKYMGKKETAVVAEAVLKERPVSHVELMECQLTVNKAITDGFKELRKELMTEIKDLHEKINSIDN